jgi:melatonin receptor type 1A
LYIPSGHKYVFNPGKFFCYLNIDDYVFLALIVTVYIALPAMVIVFCYYKVHKTIQKHNKSMSNSSLTVQEINITKTLFLIVLMFMVCWLPVFTMDIIDVIYSRWSLPREAYVVYSFLAASSSSVNPLIYAIMNPTFRKEYLTTLTCGGKCKRTRKVSPDEIKRATNTRTVQINYSK